jgi:hypothetical protein
MFVGYHEAAPLEVPEFVWQQLARFNLDWHLHAPAKYVAVDTESGKVIAVVALADFQQYLSDLWWHPAADFCDHGFCVATEEELLYFAYPLQRRWLWLLSWFLGPVMAIWFIGRALAYRRRVREFSGVR